MTIRTKARHTQQHWFKVRYLQVKPYSLVGTGQTGKSFDTTQYDHILVKMNIWLRCAGTAKFAGMVDVDKRLYWLYYCFGNTAEVQQFH